MNIRHRLLLAITGLFLFNSALAQDKTGYVVLTNAGYVDVSTTVESRPDDKAKQAEVYRDQLIIKNNVGPVNEPVIPSSTEQDK